jgi:hypothetical protein
MCLMRRFLIPYDFVVHVKYPNFCEGNNSPRKDSCTFSLTLLLLDAAHAHVSEYIHIVLLVPDPFFTHYYVTVCRICQCLVQLVVLG